MGGCHTGLSRSNTKCGQAEADLEIVFGEVRQQKDRLDLHLAKAKDHLVQTRANASRDPHWEAEVRERDKVVFQVNRFLAQRGAARLGFRV